ncbi:MAG TPA: oligosaccharide flippase family protein [Candidatus Angelobacter sp.]|nr:oligosaccharide flippase family protein [Candidatus Angelobacter sp.]
MTRTSEIYNVPKGAAYLTSQQVILYSTYLVFYLFLTRVLNTTEVGEVGILSLLQALFIGFTSGSFPSAATRFISRGLASGDPNMAGGVAKTTLRMSATLAAPGLIAGALISLFFGQSIFAGPGASELLFLTFVGGFLLDLMNLYAAFFLGIGKYAQTLYQNILYVPLSRGLGLALALQFRVLGIVLGWAIGGLLTIFFSLYMWHGQLPKSRPYPVRPILAFSTPVFASALVTIGQQWGDIGIIYALLGAGILGPYFVVVQSVSFLSALWTPVNQAIYPALSASHSTGEIEAVSDRLSLAFRLINLTVLPIGAALGAIAPTALDIVYGARYASQSLAFSILCLSSVFVAQGALLVIVLQAMGRTRKYLEVTLISTILYFTVVGSAVFLAKTAFGMNPLEALAGAIGRAVLAISIVGLANRTLRGVVRTHTGSAMSKAVPLAIGVGAPLLAVDQVFLAYHPVRPLFQLIILLGVFLASYTFVSRELRVFHRGDFAILHDALPRRLRPYLKAIQRIIISNA